jgi:glucokinase
VTRGLTRQRLEAARDPVQLRRLNLERVLAAAIERDVPFTRSELIDATGLSAPTVGSLTAHLIRLGLLTDLGAGPSRGGRRPSHMEFNARHGFVAAIDLGSTRTHLGVADLRGDLIARRTVDTAGGATPVQLLEGLANLLLDLLREADIPIAKVLAVGAGAPGAVDPARGMVVALAPNLAQWHEVPMASILRTAISAPVVVENDVNLAVLGEHWKGAARGHSSCAFLSFGTGVGAGIMVNDQLHHGHRCLAGEIGLMCMGPQYVNTDFGARGCLETLAGLGALRRRWHAAQPPSPMWAADLFAAAAAGDAAARETADDVATSLGMATANVSSLLDPSMIVLGGALVAQVPEIVDRVRTIAARILPSPPEIVPSRLGTDAPLWGALLLAIAEARHRVREHLARR